MFLSDGDNSSPTACSDVHPLANLARITVLLIPNFSAASTIVLYTIPLTWIGLPLPSSGLTASSGDQP
ncbi:hypothetical protein D3C77_342800 [compost metagenome]